MANNLRIIYKNLATTATLSGSSTASASLIASNLKNGIKSIAWRSGTSSGTTVKAFIIATLPAASTISGVILAFTNLTSVATMRVYGYTGTPPTHGGSVDSPTIGTSGATQVFDSGNVLCNPYQNLGFSNWGTETYVDRKLYSRLWLSSVDAAISCTSIVIEINDTNPYRFVEVSKLIIGNQWSPNYNTSFGLSVDTKDMSSSERTEAGDLLITRGKIYNSLSFDLKWMDKPDRIEFNNLIKTVGTQLPLFVSLFPNNSDDWEKEQMHQIYGYQSQLYSIVHPMFSMYSSQLTIEEM